MPTPIATPMCGSIYLCSFIGINFHKIVFPHEKSENWHPRVNNRLYSTWNILKVILYSQAISLLEDPLSRWSQIVILSWIDKTLHFSLVVMLAICKISINHWKLSCCYKYFDYGIWLETVWIIECSDNQGLDNRGTAVFCFTKIKW